MNTQLGKDENKFYLHNSTNRNNEYLADFFTQDQVLFINKKWIVFWTVRHASFEGLSSNHRIVPEKKVSYFCKSIKS